MPGDELLRVLHVDRLAGFEIEDHFVLGAVKFEDAADVFRARKQQQEADEDGQADHAIDRVEGDLAFERRRPVAQIFGEFERNEFVDAR